MGNAVMLQGAKAGHETLQPRIFESAFDEGNIPLMPYKRHDTHHDILPLSELEKSTQLGEAVLPAQVAGGEKNEGNAKPAELQNGLGKLVAEDALQLIVVIKDARPAARRPDAAQALASLLGKVAHAAVQSRAGEAEFGEALAAVEGDEAVEARLAPL